jgi:hypothetical protein
VQLLKFGNYLEGLYRPCTVSLRKPVCVDLKCLTYTSLAALDLGEEQLLEIHATARDFNAIDGITGLLIFDGIHFLQMVEGPPVAIDDLLERLRRDQRHSGLEVRDEHYAEERLFSGWSMELVRVRSQLLSSREDLAHHLPEGLPPAVRQRVTDMVGKVAAEIEL